jgi:hypothetical protein
MKRLAVLWIVSVVLVAMATLAFAQGRRLPQPQMLSGNDIGFRIEGYDISGKPTGAWMVRLNGEWVEVGSTMVTRPATH